MLPQVPEARPEDPEDVSWALSTAEAMWARGDHSDGIKWVRRAAEAASEAENDERALELAKAAADLAGLISRRVSRASIDLEEVEAISEHAPPPVPQARPAPSKQPPPPKPAGSLAPKPFPTSVTKQVATPSRPPAPLPSKTSQPPPAAGSQPPAAAKAKPLGTNTSKSASTRPAPAKKPRKSRENLDADARTALAVADTDQHGAVDAKSAGAVLPADTTETAAVQVAEIMNQRRRPEIGESDPTVIGRVEDIVKPTGRSSAEEWDASPTQNLTGDELPWMADGERRTVVGPSASGAQDFKSTMQSFPRPGGKPLPAAGSPATSSSPPATMAGSVLSKGIASSAAGPRTGPAEQHDPAIQTTQAVRVVVWRDANGVHLAPAGTVVSAITVDAVLVALEPSADLTAWLTQKGR